jgi:hypothetical protein
MSTISKFAMALLALALGACRGGTSTSPPVHLVLDMDFQPKLKTQSATNFESWKDGRSMRLPVAGTIAKGTLPNLTLLPDPKNAGKNVDGSWIAKNPLALTADSIARGKDRFEIHCAICHGQSAGAGRLPCRTSMSCRARTTASPTSRTASTSKSCRAPSDATRCRRTQRASASKTAGPSFTTSAPSRTSGTSKP